jgi:hypothetical protein
MFGKIGRNTPAVSGTNPLRADQLGGLVTANAGDYKDITLGGKCLFAFCASQNVALFSATSAIGLILYNPASSGVNAILHKWSAQIWATSATMTGLVLAVSAQVAAPTTLTLATLQGKTLISGSTGLPVGACTAYSVATLTTAPVIAWPLMHNTAAINTVGAEVIGGDLQGSFAIAPGTVAVIGALGAAGVTVNLGLTWEEVPVGL